jgi:VanZ family protein
MVIVALHVVPATYRPVTAVSHNLEHLAIFIVLGMAFGLGYPHRSRALAFALPLFCFAIEVVQLWIPGRHARLTDLLINAAAAVLGLWIAVFMVEKVLARTSLSRSKIDDGHA